MTYDLKEEMKHVKAKSGPVPDGFDARCHACGYPYTFHNAQAVGTEDWQHYCSDICQREAERQGE